MWKLTTYDVNRIKGQLQARRARIDAKYLEETKALDADFADLETLERVGAALALKYKSGDSADLSQETPENADDGSLPVENAAPSEPQLAVPPGDGSGPDAKLGSRWRLALRDRPVASEVE